MRSARLWTAPGALVMAALAGCAAEAGSVPPPARVSSAPAAAVCHDPLNDDDGHCAQELKDSHRRTAVPAFGHDPVLDEVAMDVYHAARAGGCLDDTAGDGGHCPGPAELAATERYVVRVRASLARAGFGEAVVRLGRPGDPTAEGALIWAVRVGDVCVLGDVTPPPVERVHDWYAGLLPDGRCLTAP